MQIRVQSNWADLGALHDYFPAEEIICKGKFSYIHVFLFGKIIYMLQKIKTYSAICAPKLVAFPDFDMIQLATLISRDWGACCGIFPRSQSATCLGSKRTDLPILNDGMSCCAALL